jgi:hypothetical protein
MPRIAKRFLDCVVYIYPNRSAADADQGYGGTGFVVARRVEGGYQTLIITNRHVIENKANQVIDHAIEAKANPVIRLNHMNGRAETFPTNRDRWKNHPDGDDLSAYQLDVSAEDHKQAWIWEEAFLTREKMDQYLGLGSDVVMLGRFIGFNGMVTNTPTARFGAIASPNTIEEGNSFGNAQETFVIECHSMPGYSGSPVIAHFPSTVLNETALENSGLGPWLLGVDWKHFARREEVIDKDGDDSGLGLFIRENSGLMGAIPAWRIPKLLNEFPSSVTGTFV